jgi:outer membrane cobalamin receptor
MHQRVKLCTLFLLAFSLTPLQRSIQAAEPEEPTTYDLGEIVVTGKTEGVQAAQSIHTVTSEDIRNREARTLEQALTLLPGLNVRTGPEGVPRIGIRGFRTRHVILLLDGVPLNSALDSQFDPSIIPTENISKIKLTSGTSSVLYGQGGLGGVINIITKKGGEGLQGLVSAETGDHAPILGRASISGARGMFDFFLSGSSSKIDGLPLSDDFSPTSEQGSDNRNNSDRERHNVYGNLGFTPNRDLTLGFSFNYSRGSFGKPSSTINDQFDIFASAPKYERIDDFEGYSLQLAADYRITNQLSLRGRAFLNRMEQQDNLYDNASFNSFNSPDSFQEQIRTSIHGVSLQPKYDLGAAGTVTFALYNEWDEWKNEGANGGSTTPTQSRDRSKGFSVLTIAAEYEISPIQGLGLSAGYSHHWQVRDETTDNDFCVTSGIYYDVFKDTRLRASFGRNIRFPALGDLYDLTQGNPSLVAERSSTYEGGLNRDSPTTARFP